MANAEVETQIKRERGLDNSNYEFQKDMRMDRKRVKNFFSSDRTKGERAPFSIESTGESATTYVDMVFLLFKLIEFIYVLFFCVSLLAVHSFVD